MPVSGAMQTRVIISAEDRGLSKLMRRLSGETDATIAKFGQLGNVLAGLSATFAAGFGVKKAMTWLDEMEKSVFSIATTLTDTMHGLSSGELSDAFDKNAKHARSMYNELQKQAKRSIADVQELMNAYQIFANVGIAAPGKSMPEAAKQIDQLVTRVKLATMDQNQQRQIFQELRALLQGKQMSSDVLSSRFGMRDKNYVQTIRQLVAQGDWDEIFNYLSSLIANISLEEKIQNLLSTKLKIVQGDIKAWSIEAFAPLKDEFVAALGDIDKEFNKADSPLVKGLTDVVTRMTDAFAKGREILTKFLKTDVGKWFTQLTPKILAMAGAMTTLTMAVAGLKAAMGVFWTLPGMAMGAWMGYEALKTYNAQQGTQFNGDLWSNKENGEFDWDNFAKGIEEVIADKINGIGSSFMAYVKTAFDALAVMVSSVLEGILKSAVMAWESQKDIRRHIGILVDAIKDTTKGIYDIIVEYLKIAVLSIDKYLNMGIAKTIAGIGNMVNVIAEALMNMPIIGKSVKEYWSKHNTNSLMESADKFNARVNLSNEEIGLSKSKIAGISIGSIWSDATRRADESSAQMERDLEANPLMRMIRGFEGTRKKYMDAFAKDSQAVLDMWVGRNVVQSVSRAAAESGNVDAITKPKSPVTESLQMKDFVKQGRDLEKLLGRNVDLDKAIADMQKLMAKGGDEFTAEMANINATIQRFNKAAQIAGTSTVSYSQKLEEYMDFMNSEAKDDLVLKAQKEKELAEIYNKVRADAEKTLAEKSALFNQIYNALSPELTRQANVKVANSYEDKSLGLLGLASGNLERDSRAQISAEQLKMLIQIRDVQQEITGKVETGTEAEKRRLKVTDDYKKELIALLPLLEKQEAIYAKINELLSKDETIQAGMLNGMNSYVLSIGSTFEQITQLTEGVLETMQSTFGDVFYDFLIGQTKSFKEYFRNFCTSLTKLWADTVAQMAMQAAVKGMLNWFTTPTPSANGNVLRGGFHAFADGGVVTRPTLGVIGEGKYNEAVVPLPDGRTIPVRMQNGGGGGNVTVNIINRTGEEISKNVSTRKDDMGQTIIDVVIDAVNRNKNGFRNQLASQLQMS